MTFTGEIMLALFPEKLLNLDRGELYFVTPKYYVTKIAPIEQDINSASCTVAVYHLDTPEGTHAIRPINMSGIQDYFRLCSIVLRRCRQAQLVALSALVTVVGEIYKELNLGCRESSYSDVLLAMQMSSLKLYKDDDTLSVALKVRLDDLLKKDFSDEAEYGHVLNVKAYNILKQWYSLGSDNNSSSVNVKVDLANINIVVLSPSILSEALFEYQIGEDPVIPAIESWFESKVLNTSSHNVYVEPMLKLRLASLDIKGKDIVWGWDDSPN
jgi:hypothetical protein